MNPTLIHALGQSMALLSLALIMGGTLALGAFTAPGLFQSFPRPEAGQAMTLIFRRYDTVMMIALILLVLGQVAQFSTSQSLALAPNWLVLARHGMGLGLAVLLSINLFSLNPRLEAAQQQGVALLPANDPAVVAFNKTHDQSEKVYKLAFVVAMLLLVSLPWVHPTYFHTLNPADLS